MMRKLLVAFGLALAVACAPLAAVAHEGHDHGAKTKKVKKPRAKKAAASAGIIIMTGDVALRMLVRLS